MKREENSWNVTRRRISLDAIALTTPAQEKEYAVNAFPITSDHGNFRVVVSQRRLRLLTTGLLSILPASSSLGKFRLCGARQRLMKGRCALEI
jgi:hypothetical protein